MLTQSGHDYADTARSDRLDWRRQQEDDGFMRTIPVIRPLTNRFWNASHLVLGAIIASLWLFAFAIHAGLWL